MMISLWDVPCTNGVYSHSPFLFTQHHFRFASCAMDNRARNSRYDKQYFVFSVYQLLRYIQMHLQRQSSTVLLFGNIPIPWLDTVVTRVIHELWTLLQRLFCRSTTYESSCISHIVFLQIFALFFLFPLGSSVDNVWHCRMCV